MGKCVIAVHRRALARHDQVRGTRLAYRYRRALYCESDHHLPAHCMGGSIGPATGGCVRRGHADVVESLRIPGTDRMGFGAT